MSAAHRLLRSVITPAAICLAIGLPSANPTFAATGWESIPTVHAGGGQAQDFLSGVAIESIGKAWAVGEFLDGSSRSHSLLIQWNGTVWHQVASPNPGGISAQSKNALEAVAIAPDGSGFAVGNWWSARTDGVIVMRTHNGTWVRDVVAGQHVGLFGVSALSANEAWAVGSDRFRAATFHWNGSTWTEVPVPYPGGYVVLSGVAEVSAHNVWAAGSVDNGDNPPTMFILHWDGQSWTRATHVHSQGYLHGITARNAHDVWAVGSSGFAPGEVPVALHYDGRSWAATAPEHASGRNADSSFSSAVTVGKHKVWAVGQSDKVTQAGTHALIEEWNGSAWSIVPNPSVPAPNYSALDGIAAGAGHLWAVGTTGADALTLYHP